MAVTAEPRSDDRIIIFSYNGIVTLDDALFVFAETSRFINQIGGGYIYRISDFTYAESTLAEIMKMLQVVSAQAGGTADPNILVIFIGSTAWARLYKDAMGQSQHGGKYIPMVQTLDEALDYIRVHKEENAS